LIESFTVVVCWSEPLVPVIVSVNVPRAPLAVRTVSVDDVPVAGFGENEAVAPDGSPLTAKVTEPVKPLTRAIVTA
jgi:hypothetical protein